jgi:hypothetical protein
MVSFDIAFLSLANSHTHSLALSLSLYIYILYITQKCVSVSHMSAFSFFVYIYRAARRNGPAWPVKRPVGA